MAAKRFVIKGHVISKGFFGVFNFFQKTNENTSHGSKNEFIRLFLERFTAWQFAFEIIWPLKKILSNHSMPFLQWTTTDIYSNLKIYHFLSMVSVILFFQFFFKSKNGVKSSFLYEHSSSKFSWHSQWKSNVLNIDQKLLQNCEFKSKSRKWKTIHNNKRTFIK